MSLVKYRPSTNGTAFAGMFSNDGLYRGSDYEFYLAADVDPVLAQLKEALAMCLEKPEKMLAAMRRNNLKIDDHSDPMQTLAFTCYTELCELAGQAEAVLKEMT